MLSLDEHCREKDGQPGTSRVNQSVLATRPHSDRHASSFLHPERLAQAAQHPFAVNGLFKIAAGSTLPPGTTAGLATGCSWWTPWTQAISSSKPFDEPIHQVVPPAATVHTKMAKPFWALTDLPS
ncbi:unnamed protein product [Clonostachys solani]|uniref:Uncharacterized protein n=1 Tax=Clonostachys solani TaxID=160281 RepID=A0A9N9ZP39_9HYPO|nr:unnamed protein product [Clonostachys solani]